MFQDECTAAANGAKNKTALLQNNPLGYFIASMLAGMYVGFGILLIFSIGGMLPGAPFAKIIMGICFGIALSLVIMAGAELFTGNNMIMIFGLSQKTVTWGETLWLWLVCFAGNWLGSALLAIIFCKSGLAVGPIGQFIGSASATKMNLPIIDLFLRGILCNTLVCLAVWCSIRLKSDSGKLIMVFWCLFAFITTGFEHSVANMTLLSVGLFSSLNEAVSLQGYLYNISIVTLGNMVGGIVFVALPYVLISKKNDVA